METNNKKSELILEIGRLILRSAIIGATIPVYEGDFDTVKIFQMISAIVLSLILFGLERLFLWAFRIKTSIDPLKQAAFRGGILYGLLKLLTSGDPFKAIGAILGGAVMAYLLFKLEEVIIKKTNTFK